MAKSRRRREHQPWTLPALPAPPDDALPPPLFICGFRPARRRSALLPGRPRVGRWARREARGRTDPTDRASSPVSAPPRRQGRAPGCPCAAPPAPRTLPGAPASPAARSEQPGQGRRETDRQSDLPSSLRPSPARARTQRKERGPGAGSWFGCAGCTAPASGAGGGGCGLRGGTEERDPRVPGKPRGARGAGGCGRRAALGV